VFAIYHTAGDLIVAEDGATIQAQKKIKTTGITDISINLGSVQSIYISVLCHIVTIMQHASYVAKHIIMRMWHNTLCILKCYILKY
jgi:hypothetical protein